MKTEVKYSSDLTSPQWQLIRQLLPQQSRLGRRPIDRRRIINAIFVRSANRLPVAVVAEELSEWSTVYDLFWRWRNAGIWQKIHDALRAKARKTAGKKSTPTVAIVDSQSVRTAEGGEERGYDAAKKITGRKRHVAVDTLGLLLAVVVHAADWQDQDGAEWVMDKLGEQFRRIKVIFGDLAYGRGGLPEWVKETFGWILQTVLRPVGIQGLVVLPKRWIVERTSYLA